MSRGLSRLRLIGLAFLLFSLLEPFAVSLSVAEEIPPPDIAATPEAEPTVEIPPTDPIPGPTMPPAEEPAPEPTVEPTMVPVQEPTREPAAEPESTTVMESTAESIQTTEPTAPGTPSPPLARNASVGMQTSATGPQVDIRPDSDYVY